MLDKLKKSKNKTDRNGIQVKVIKSGLKELKEEIKDMSEQEKETENPNEKVDIVKNILEFNGQQQGQRLKILTPNQTLSRLPISLAKLKAGNNSEKPNIEIRQVFHSFIVQKTFKKYS